MTVSRPYDVPHMENYFHIDHDARTAYITTSLNLVTESQKYGKLRDFREKIVMGYIDIVVLDQCCCAKNIATCLWVFCHEFDEMARGRSHNPSQ